jgi:hypothetical protein
VQSPLRCLRVHWREIATEISCEQDPQKMAVLLAELNRPLEEQVLTKAKPAYGQKQA